MTKPSTHKLEAVLARSSFDPEVNDLLRMVSFALKNGGASGAFAWLAFRLQAGLYQGGSAVADRAELILDALVFEIYAAEKVKKEPVKASTLSHQERIERIIEREEKRRTARPVCHMKSAARLT